MKLDRSLSCSLFPVPCSLFVIKIGGSLFDLPDLGRRLSAYLAALPAENVLLVPGGGRTADAVRELDQTHRLGEQQAHWIALRSLTINAYFLQTLLPEADVIAAATPQQRTNALSIVDAFAFAQADEGRSGALPHTWNATSDALAARVAVIHDARELILLKSVTMPADMNWPTAVQYRFVDGVFPTVVEQLGGRCAVRVVNFREPQAG